MRRPSGIFWLALLLLGWLFGTFWSVFWTTLAAAVVAILARKYLFETVLQNPVPMNTAVLVTGCSTGFGREFVLDLSARGFRVFAGVRKPEDGEKLVELAPASSRERITPLILDVTKPEQIERAVTVMREKLEEWTCRLYAVVANAGVHGLGPVEAAPLDKMRYTFEVNFWGPVALVRACMPLLRECPSAGRIVLVSSIGGVTSVLHMGYYSASKFALEAIGDALRQELRAINSRIRVTVVEPGSYDTAIVESYAQASRDLLEESKDQNGPMVQLYANSFKKLVATTHKARPMLPKADALAKQLAVVLLAKYPPARIMTGMDAIPMGFVGNFLPEPVIDAIFSFALTRG
jgi:NAD(P)-dependent dehydrogenase (short-subunit alcohol dehydrogenase family)